MQFITDFFNAILAGANGFASITLAGGLSLFGLAASVFIFSVFFNLFKRRK